MMKKVAMVAAAAAMVLPLGLGAIAPAMGTTTAFAATKTAAKKTTYNLKSATTLKKTAYHVKAGKPTLFSGAFAADRAKVTFAKKGTLKTGTTYYATKKVVVTTKATKKAKAKTMTCVYVKTANGKVKGWVAFGDLAAGKATKKAVVKKATKKATTKKAVKADKATGKTYTLLKAKTLKKTAYHYKATAPAFYTGKFAADQSKVTLTKKGVLPASKTFYATKEITVKQNKKNVKYLYVTNNKTKGFVQANKLTAGAFKAAD
ncbi:hypothetical protein LZY01_23470 [Levilactobacillus zymae]|uniref:D-alanyl-D-alanine carboxypeptidase n=1 Tax=Levilactobacillus zymae TaxID=267363 RepID=A0ABQ0WZ18_9LACO|nr:hypothetical protein [Levilactobacillus zymae]QFR61647.1 hypothetical protein LZ395_08985 [Levilactobacillus zymae]GEO73179.1 hypothetical protein LZY01_23470 [Levilactobacillus zymae]